ncbi:hypothetical protein [Paenibacillus alba]|uniref:DUF5666 domain-containing protein n=1 Tax=Paenibacillus alba TaxID=1197127 RepID=A0ABU6GGM2_9BACL|nr:hypothetical protein [Paenibacillus alba]MEC0231883.1 hypothetical protein [Paenibacillus alba]
MRKRWPFILGSITLVALLFYGWTAYAASSPAQSISSSIKGTYISTSPDTIKLSTASGDQTIPLAKSIWVYRDELKAQLADVQAGDQLELILNSKQQAAYIKAASAGSAAATVEATAGTAAGEAAPIGPVAPVATTAPAPVSASASASSAVPSPTPVPAGTTNGQLKEAYPDLESMELSVDGKHFKLHIGQSKGPKGAIYDLSIKPEDAGMIHLKDAQAAAWIQELLASVDLKSSGAEKAIAQQLAEHYRLDANKLNVHMKTKWMPDQAPAKQMNSDTKHKVKEKHEEDQSSKHDDDPANKQRGNGHRD